MRQHLRICTQGGRESWASNSSPALLAAAEAVQGARVAVMVPAGAVLVGGRWVGVRNGNLGGGGCGCGWDGGWGGVVWGMPGWFLTKSSGWLAGARLTEL